MKLQEGKPIAVFDLETTGIDVTNDRIVEIAILKSMPDGTELKYQQRVNPEMPIPAESSAIHGIYDQDVADAPTFKDIAADVVAFIGDADLAGYNSNKFDIPVLAEEFLRADCTFNFQARNFIDVQNIFHKMEQRTLVAAYKFYCDKDLINAHNAMADVEATFEVFKAQLERYEQLERSSDFLSKFTQINGNKPLDFAGRLAVNKNGDAIYNFGKHKGKTIQDVSEEEPGYYGWMMNSNFPLYTKSVLKQEMEKIKAKKIAHPTEKIEDKLAALKNKFNK
jgi:DNA polymerase III subunit epsilon